jgi:hypothetical protein
MKYYIPFKGKRTVDDIIKKHGNENRKDEILWYCKFDGSNMGTSFRNNQYTYDQFVNSDFLHLEYLGRKIGGPSGMSNLGRIDRAQAVHGSCPCSKYLAAQASKTTNIQ